MPLAQNITVIPAIRKVGTQKPETKVQKTRVAAYCRVSTEYEEQESSYDVQVEHYTTYIKSKPEWEFVEVYADDEERNEFIVQSMRFPALSSAGTVATSSEESSGTIMDASRRYGAASAG